MSDKLVIPDGHHPGIVISLLVKRKGITEKVFSEHVNIQIMIIKRFFLVQHP